MMLSLAFYESINASIPIEMKELGDTLQTTFEGVDFGTGVNTIALGVIAYRLPSPQPKLRKFKYKKDRVDKVFGMIVRTGNCATFDLSIDVSIYEKISQDDKRWFVADLINSSFQLIKDKLSCVDDFDADEFYKFLAKSLAN